MKPRPKTLVAGISALIAVSASLSMAILDEEPLPELVHPCIVDIFPEFDLRAIKVGQSESEVFDHFGKRGSQDLLEDAMRPARCVAFTYDPELLNDSPWSITVLLDAGRVRDRWLTKEPVLSGRTGPPCVVEA